MGVIRWSYAKLLSRANDTHFFLFVITIKKIIVIAPCKSMAINIYCFIQTIEICMINLHNIKSALQGGSLCFSGGW